MISPTTIGSAKPTPIVMIARMTFRARVDTSQWDESDCAPVEAGNLRPNVAASRRSNETESGTLAFYLFTITARDASVVAGITNLI
jgi:hypothetical protein